MTSSNDTGMEQGVVGTAGAVGMQQQHLLHQQHPQPHHPHQWPLPPGAGRTMVTSLARQVAVQPPQHQPQPLPPPHQQHALSSSGRHLLPSGGPPQGPPAGGGQAVPYIGAPISLISKSEIRYEGTLYTIDTKVREQGLFPCNAEGIPRFCARFPHMTYKSRLLAPSRLSSSSSP